MIRMTREQHAKWDAALRSGEYPQGTQQLRTHDGKYCCMGVLQMALDGRVENHGNIVFPLSVPSREWLKAHGIEFQYSLYENDDCVSPFMQSLQCTLIKANDTLRLPFAKIADAIALDVEYI